MKDVQIDINIEEIPGDKIEWIKYSSDQELIKFLNLIEHYKFIKDELLKCIIEISNVKEFDNRHSLEIAGKRAIYLISKIEVVPKYQRLESYINDALLDMEHTMQKEVDMVVRVVRLSASKKRKKEALWDAKKHLLSDIKGFQAVFSNFYSLTS